MRWIRGTTVAFAFAAMSVGVGCGGGGETRGPARVPATGKTSAALTTSTTTTTSASASASASVTPGTNATMAPLATPVFVPPPPPPVSVSSAVMRVTTTRCDREAACSHVGTGRAFGDRDACVNEIGHDVVSVLSAEECPSGVDTDRLSACVAELKAQSCEGGTASAEALPASCARDQLCTRSFAYETR